MERYERAVEKASDFIRADASIEQFAQLQKCRRAVVKALRQLIAVSLEQVENRFMTLQVLANLSQQVVIALSIDRLRDRQGGELRRQNLRGRGGAGRGDRMRRRVRRGSKQVRVGVV